MKKLILAAALISCSHPALAQSWDTGPQTPSYPGGASGSYPGVLGDGGFQGGTPPAEATEVPDISSNFDTTQWIAADPSFTSATGAENKFRFNCNVTGQGFFDPILYPGQKNVGHEHTFIGPLNFNENSNYASLRANGGNSHCSGGPLNRSLYWETSVKKPLASGIKATIKPDWATFYYTFANSDTGKYYRLLNGIQFIGGKWPADLTDSARKAEIPSGFTWVTDGFSGNGMGWYCENATGNPKPALKNADGSDPWGGTCVSPNRIYAQIQAPECWDGRNKTAPDGRSHLRYYIRHSNSGALVCPTGWWRIPAIEVKIFFSHNGPSDYLQWYCSSDFMTPGARACETMHFDYIQAWDPPTLKTFQSKCLGITIGALTGSPLQCDSGTISSTQRLKGGGNNEASPDGSQPNPIMTLNNYYAGQKQSVRFFPPLPGTTGTTGHLHHGVPPTQ